MRLATGDIAADGFEIVPRVFVAGEMENLLREVGHFPRTRAGMRHLMSSAAIAKIANDPRMLELTSASLGDGARPFKATLFDKSSEANWLVVWHQDTALPLMQRHNEAGWGPWSVKEGITYAHAPAWALEEVIALRLSLDDSTDENGPLRVLPGTHVLGLLTDDEISHEVKGRDPFTCTVAQGGIVIMRPLAIHGSSKSISSRPRRVLHIEYASQALRQKVKLAVA